MQKIYIFDEQAERSKWRPKTLAWKLSKQLGIAEELAEAWGMSKEEVAARERVIKDNQTEGKEVIETEVKGEGL